MSTELGGGIAGQRLVLECENNFQHDEFGMHRARAQRDDSAAPIPVRFTARAPRTQSRCILRATAACSEA